MLIRLEETAIETFYPWLLDNFPAAEVKPLPWIKAMLARGDYSLFAWQEETRLLGLAFFYHDREGEAPALLDYLLIHPEAQGQGLGSKLLSTLMESECLKNGFLVELERLDQAKTEEDYRQRQRRRSFYQKLGFQATALLSEVFGVGYRIYHSPTLEQPESQLKARYLTIYQAMIPETLFQEQVKL